MSFVVQTRPSDSPFVEAVMHGHTADSGVTIRPAECHWHLVLVTFNGETHARAVGPLTSSGELTYVEGIQLLWLKLKLGVYMPHLPVSELVDGETVLPGASSGSFWLQSSAWQFPDFENADSFVARLAREGVLARDPLVDTVLRGQAPAEELAERTLRHRFARATGLSHNDVRQIQRAQRAAALLREGLPILDAVDELGYYDQPHLTRALRRWVGHTPGQIAP